ncbi:hypothetical protein ACFL5D_00285 [Candidatus Neomarinimicrobiota bacterium]
MKYYLFYFPIYIFLLLLSTGCNSPFKTDTTVAIFELFASHDIVRVMPSATVLLFWDEITVESFQEYKIERKTVNDTAWTEVKSLYNPLQITYVDTIWNDDDLIYRVGIVDVDENTRWATTSISIPRTTSVIVPDVFETIQPAFVSGLMDDGDTIIVKPGTYEETISIAGKDVLIKSTDGFKSTLLLRTARPDSIDQLRVVNISSGILDGFSIKFGDPMHGSGGGISISKNATVKNCYIAQNVADSNENGGGGGVFLGDNGNLYNNIIAYNSSYMDFANGIYIVAAHGEIINNTIVGNDIVIRGDCTGLLLRNNIIFDSYPDISFAPQASQAGVTIDYSLFDNNVSIGSDNINANPDFMDNVDFILSPNSPCIDAGHPDNQYLDKDGTRNDIGAYGGPLARL